MSLYKPRGDSAAKRVLDFFAANPDEELTSADIARKFDIEPKSVHSSLKAVIDAGLLVRDRNDDLEMVFRRGQASAGASPFAGLSPGPSEPTTESINALSVDDNVPLTVPRSNAAEKWAPLFDRLQKPGQSIALPREWRTSLAREANKRNRLAEQGGGSNLPPTRSARTTTRPRRASGG